MCTTLQFHWKQSYCCLTKEEGARSYSHLLKSGLKSLAEIEIEPQSKAITIRAKPWPELSPVVKAVHHAFSQGVETLTVY